jgi:hypothetical protein
MTMDDETRERIRLIHVADQLLAFRRELERHDNRAPKPTTPTFIERLREQGEERIST